MTSDSPLPRGIKIAHLNARSIVPKVDSINIWLEKVKYDVVTINETWLSPNIPSSHLDISDYNIIRQDRTTGKRGGGLITLIKKDRNICYNVQNHNLLNISTPNVEMLITDLKIGQAKKMIVVNCYRPPSGKVAECFAEIEGSLDKIDKLAEFELYINGDFNIAYNNPELPEFKKLKIFEKNIT